MNNIEKLAIEHGAKINESQDVIFDTDFDKTGVMCLKAFAKAYAQQSSEPVAETAWLVEKDIGGFPNYLYCDCIGLLSWTPSNQKAMRFARKEDADSIVSIVEDADRVAQHMWSTP